MKTVYQEHGHANRNAYLRSLSDEYGAPPFVVHALADLLGPEEDFDGLVVALEDHQDEII